MARLGLFPVILRELLSWRGVPREPEPALVMSGPDQVAAFTEAGRIDGVMAASYLFQSAAISQVIRGCKRVVDIGCGPATQLGQLAQLNPQVSFRAVDLSEEMLAQAKRRVDELGLRNVELLRGDMTDLRAIDTGSADGVISTVALHHLPTLDHLARCFSEVRRVLRPNGALYLVDFGRLRSHHSMRYFAYMNAAHQPPIFSEDYFLSLRAAFEAEDFVRLTRDVLGAGYRVVTTVLVPFMVVVTNDTPPVDDPELRATVRRLREELPPAYRSDLDLMRRFFRLGGLPGDPFRP